MAHLLAPGIIILLFFFVRNYVSPSGRISLSSLSLKRVASTSSGWVELNLHNAVHCIAWGVPSSMLYFSNYIPLALFFFTPKTVYDCSDDEFKMVETLSNDIGATKFCVFGVFEEI